MSLLSRLLAVMIQPESYRRSVASPAERLNAMIITNGAFKLMREWADGPLAREYSLSSDWDDRWRTGGSVAEVIEEAHLDEPHILAPLERFAAERDERAPAPAGTARRNQLSADELAPSGLAADRIPALDAADESSPLVGTEPKHRAGSISRIPDQHKRLRLGDFNTVASIGAHTALAPDECRVLVWLSGHVTRSFVRRSFRIPRIWRKGFEYKKSTKRKKPPLCGILRHRV